MKKTVSFNFLNFSSRRDGHSIVHESDFKLGFSPSPIENGFTKTLAVGKSSLISIPMLLLFFLFTNFLFAQQPACNLKGSLEVPKASEGGKKFKITPDLVKVVPGTTYSWEFVSNTSGATFKGETNRSSVEIEPGNIKGSLNLKLTLINPATAETPSKTCSCTKSISIGNP